MPWWCPACRRTVIHSQGDERPDPAETYHCYACRLDLRFDALMDRLAICAYQPDRRPVTRASGGSQRPIPPVEKPKAS
jgi:hypothetical protein